MKSLVQTHAFHSDKCVFNLRTEGCCLNRDHVSVSLCPLHESPSCTGSHFSTSELFPPSVTPHIVVLAASQREGDVLKVIRADYFPVRRTHLRQTHASLHLIFLQSVCFCGSPESLMLAKQVFPSFLLSHGIFSEQHVNSQAIKDFGFCFSRDALGCQGGKVIDSWLELLCHSEPTEHTCPSRTILSSPPFGFLHFLS